MNDVVSSSIASSLALPTGEQKELGALVIDLGVGITEYAVYSEGIIRQFGVLAVGGDHVTNDLAYGLNISLRRAEKLKREHGYVSVTDVTGEQTDGVTDERGMEIKRVNAGHVQMIMSLRYEEIFKIIADELAEVGLAELLRVGVLFCGGGAHVPFIVARAETMF